MEGPGVCQESEAPLASILMLTALSSLTAFTCADSVAASQCCGMAAVRVGPEDTCLDSLGVCGEDLLSAVPPGVAPGRLLEALSFCWDGSCKIIISFMSVRGAHFLS